MSNDLISREALKKHILEIFEEEEKHDKKWAMGLKYSIKIIDNAPIVDGYTLEQVKELFDLNVQMADEIENLKRPQGEWINEWQEIKGGRTYGACCSLCHINGHSGYNFCPNCGAYMKGGKDNESKS